MTQPKGQPLTLFLTIKKKWFDEIKAGIKKIEYREFKEYWRRRLEGRQYDTVTFQNGYNADSPRITVEYLGFYVADGCYCIKLGDILP